MKFSESKQQFYPDYLSYSELPDDLAAITPEDHIKVLEWLNEGRYVTVKVKGKTVKLSSSEPKPSSEHYWKDGAWVTDVTLADRITYAKSTISKAFIRILKDPFNWNGLVFKMDKSPDDLVTIGLYAQADAGQSWITTSNEIQHLTPEDVKLILASRVEFVNRAAQWNSLVKGKLDACKTDDEIAKVLTDNQFKG